MTRCAFLIMHPDFSSRIDRASIHSGDATIIGVSSIDDACCVAVELKEEGIGCIELCGAFTEEGARKVIEATGGMVPVGFVTHLPAQDALFSKAFG